MGRRLQKTGRKAKTKPAGVGTSGQRPAKKATGLARKRKRPLEQPAKPTIKTKGYFVDQDVVDEHRQHLEPAELKSFFKAMPVKSFWYAYFYIMYFFGCRLSEPALIFDGDVSFEKKMIVIKRLKKTSESDGYRKQVYPADPRVLDAVRTALSHKAERCGVDTLAECENPFLFPSTRQTSDGEVGAERLSQLRNSDGFQAVSRFTAHRQFERIAKEVKLPPHLQHSIVLRHTRAIIMLACDSPPENVQHLLGHSSLKMTMRYMNAANAMRARLTKEVLAMGLGL